jgi:radical SAM superfamily enzyme YgiQ (UPF0313 family)
MFNVTGVAEAWRTLPGIAGIVGGEADRDLPELVEALCEGDDIGRFPGVTLPDGSRSSVAPPLRDLDATPTPDFTDFPWARYPVRIVPLMTGRGCQWSKCLFCSDVVSASGRTFRTRSVGPEAQFVSGYQRRARWPQSSRSIGGRSVTPRGSSTG